MIRVVVTFKTNGDSGTTTTNVLNFEQQEFERLQKDWLSHLEKGMVHSKGGSYAYKREGETAQRFIFLRFDDVLYIA